VGQALRGTPLAAATNNAAHQLGQDERLRERVYQSIYQYCYLLKYGLGRAESTEKLIYALLYQDFHLSDLAAAQLTPHLLSRYAQPVPPLPYTVLPTDAPAVDKHLTGQTGRTGGAVGRQDSKPVALDSTPDIEIAGWRLIYMPRVEIEADGRSTALFRLKLNSDGLVVSVAKTSGNMSPEQVQRCRQALQEARFTRADPAIQPADSFNYRFSTQ
jgi:hypothetical protein